jgi:tetratricopeptide (TPR) repeat protein
MISDRLHIQQRYFSKVAAVSADLLSKAQTQKSGGAKNLYFLGLAAYVLTEYNIASENLISAYTLEPNADTAARVAMCYWRLGKLTDAAGWIDRAISADPKGILVPSIVETRPPFLSISAAIRFDLGEVDKSESLARQSLDLAADDVVALAVLANASMVKGNVGKAAEALAKSAAAVPPDSLTHLDLGHATKLLDDLKAAHFTAVPFVSSAAIVMSNAA